MYFYLYQDNKSEWRWTLRAANHEAIGVSSEGYSSRQGALNSIALVKGGAGSAGIYDHSKGAWI